MTGTDIEVTCFSSTSVDTQAEADASSDRYYQEVWGYRLGTRYYRESKDVYTVGISSSAWPSHLGSSAQSTPQSTPTAPPTRNSATLSSSRAPASTSVRTQATVTPTCAAFVACSPRGPSVRSVVMTSQPVQRLHARDRRRSLLSSSQSVGSSAFSFSAQRVDAGVQQKTGHCRSAVG